MSDTSSEPYDPTIEPLRDESNFYMWKFEMTHHLRFLNLLKIVRGTIPRPATAASTPDPPSPVSPPSKSKRTREQQQWDS